MADNIMKKVYHFPEWKQPQCKACIHRYEKAKACLGTWVRSASEVSVVSYKQNYQTWKKAEP